MKQTVTISILIAFLIINSLIINCQTSDYYNIKIRNGYQKKDLICDTVVPIDFLSDTTAQGLVNLQFFEGFNYPKLQYNKSKKTVKLFNDTIEIKISIAPFDLKYFLNHYQSDSSLYFKNLYYQAIPFDVFLKFPYYPETVVSDITFRTNKRKIHLPKNEFNRLYNPDLGSLINDNSKFYGVNAYLADNKKILLTIFCGEGAGASIVIFIIGPEGSIENKIMESVI